MASGIRTVDNASEGKKKYFAPFEPSNFHTRVRVPAAPSFFPVLFFFRFLSQFFLLPFLYCELIFCCLRWKTKPTCNFPSSFFFGGLNHSSTANKNWSETLFLRSGRWMQHGQKLTRFALEKRCASGEGPFGRNPRGLPSIFSTFLIPDLPTVNNSILFFGRTYAMAHTRNRPLTPGQSGIRLLILLRLLYY